MSTIRVERKHQLGKEVARQKAERLVDKLVSKYDMNAEWKGDVVELTRSGVTGQVAVGEDNVVVELKLGMMLSMMGPMIESEVDRALDKALA
ncbi:MULTISPECIES: polyhydroxyalkanoic acid system family protein [Pseudomonas]|uniref:Polyhydroxyalkanoic acid system protein n=1 Tax=Pseudomonas quercus TaxID=2722792 RepID=A0ABX0YBH9_9PSED|nr:MULTISPECIES: polyhydroxyalkanoic acid system family protein [Pseudomonas]MBF7142142.1 polyhydroxyalkanoic acid system family protein [Pseudomonas sp. LY10J]NJP00680.1 polyhydroxyalkanoic acid system protein [Pseudomonas quercus]